MEKNDAKKIAVIGSGFVGKATGKGILQKGHPVTFFDVQPKVIQDLGANGYDARHIGTIAESEDDFDIFMLSVWTPTIRKKIVLRYLEAAVRDVGLALKKTAADFPLVVIRSTVPPGTIEKKLVPILEKTSGKKIDEDFGVCMNPEFLREVSAEEDYAHPWLIVIGADDKLSGLLLGKVYEPFRAPIVHMSLAEAEMMKYVHNLLNATKISFFNEMRMVGDRLEIDSDSVFKATLKSAEAVWNPEYGTRNFGPFSGSCLPKDTQAFLNWTSEELDFELPVLQGVIRTNDLLKEASLKNSASIARRMIGDRKKIYSKKYSPSFINY